MCNDPQEMGALDLRKGEKMKQLRIAIGVMSVVLCLPVSLYLQYKTLKMIGASELMMFLFWVNLPLIVLFTTMEKIISKSLDEK